MNKRSRIILRVFLFIALFIGAQKFCHKMTEGFSVHKIANNRPIESQAEISKEVENLLKQPFHFLGKGGQCYAFLSEDGKTVIKFFKHHHMGFWKWLGSISLSGPLDNYRNKILKKHHHQSSDFFFESCRIADEEFKERAGLIYLHVKNTQCFNRKLKIFDKLGIAHQIDLDATDFALQMRADPSYPKFKQMLEENRQDDAKKCIDSILGLIVERCQKGIGDRDPNIRTNFGFIDCEAIEIDIGSYLKQAGLNYKAEMQDITSEFKEWLEDHNAELSQYLSDRIEALSIENNFCNQ